MAVFMLMLQALKQTSLKQDLDAKEIQGATLQALETGAERACWMSGVHIARGLSSDEAPHYAITCSPAVGVKKAVNVAARGISKTVTRARTALGPRVGGTSLSQVHPFSVLSNMSTRSVNGALGGAGKATGPRQGQQRADKQPSVGFGGKVFGGSVSGASGSRAAGGNAGSAVSSGGAGGGGRSANASAVAVGAGSHAEVNMPRGASGMFDATVDGYAPSAGGGDLESGPLLPPGIGRADPSADRPRRMDSHASTARSDGRSQHGDEEGEGEEEDEGEDGDDENDRDGGFARDLITGRRLAGRSSGGGGGGEMEATLALDGGALGDGIDWVNSLYNAMCIISAILTIVACGIRFYMRVRGWATHPSWVPYDAELLAIATWLGFLYLMYYVRCFRHVGRLVIALIQIVLDDVAKILFICAFRARAILVFEHCVRKASMRRLLCSRLVCELWWLDARGRLASPRRFAPFARLHDGVPGSAVRRLPARGTNRPAAKTALPTLLPQICKLRGLPSAHPQRHYCSTGLPDAKRGARVLVHSAQGVAHDPDASVREPPPPRTCVPARPRAPTRPHLHAARPCTDRTLFCLTRGGPAPARCPQARRPAHGRLRRRPHAGPRALPVACVHHRREHSRAQRCGPAFARGRRGG